MVSWALFALLLGCGSLEATWAAEVPLQVPQGFEVTQFADDALAHDIFAMTVDPQGRVVVSGRGYIKILVDADGDGRADEARLFADGPATGAQGLCFHGTDLLAIGDGALLRYRDRDGDGRADGPPDRFLKLRTGGEHHVHAIRRGPDGWWYVIAGNDARITADYATEKTSPIRRPRAGTLLRLAPDLSGGEILAHGFRNPYDFDFNELGDQFTYDSDGERDVSLPWYRPTRVFHVLPGSDAGWVSRSWKRPDDFLDMPPVVASFGRGSPTGVVCYRHRQFPRPYRGALFVLDWTFGRVLALPLERDGAGWRSKPTLFMQARGQFGFAPTDIAVAPDGALLVSVGGRGTQGAVFRVRYVGRSPEKPKHPGAADPESSVASEADSPETQLRTCLESPQPLSAWSRARWLPLADQLGADAFRRASLDPQRTASQRLRAIEILTERFGGGDAGWLARLAAAGDPRLRARAVWSFGRTGRLADDAAALATLVKLLNDRDPLVVRCALEALDGRWPTPAPPGLIEALARQLGSDDRRVRQAAARIVAQLPEPAFQQVSASAIRTGWRAALWNAVGYRHRHEGLDSYAIEIGLRILEADDQPESLKLEAVRLIQLGLGGMGPGRPSLPPVFDGYRSRLDLDQFERELDPVRVRIADLYPTGLGRVDEELERVVAILKPYHGPLLERVLSRLDETSDPVADTHRLIVAARMPVLRTEDQRRRIARALVLLEPKIERRGLNRDSHWEQRIAEVYRSLVEVDPDLPAAILNQPEFGRPGHVLYMSEFPQALHQRAVEAFVKAIRAEPEYPWTPDVVFVLGSIDDAEHRALVREQYDRLDLRPAVLMVLAENPQAEDRAKFVAGLDSPYHEVIEACLGALETLTERSDLQKDEIVALVRALRSLVGDESSYRLRERIVQLLRRKTGRQFGFVGGREGYRPQRDAVERWTQWAAASFPEAASRLLGSDADDREHLRQLLAQVDWDAGDADRGRELFRSRGCAQCHGSRQALGPDLAGVTARFSRDDLFAAIAFPNRDVSPRYRTTLIQTQSGRTYTGLIVYESVDGLLLRDSTARTFRIEADEIEFRRRLPRSLMPTGLLKDMTARDIADLDAYLRSLGRSDADTAGANPTPKAVN